MNRRRLLMAGLVLLFVSLTAFLGWKLVKAIKLSREIHTLLDRFEAAGDTFSPPELEDMYAEAQRLYAVEPSRELRDALYRLSLNYAWSHPDKPLDALRRMLKLGREAYRDYTEPGPDYMPWGANHLGGQLMWGYAYAGLPQATLSWHDRLADNNPQLHATERIFQTDAQLQLDDPAGARQLVEDDLKAPQGDPAVARAMAMAVYTTLLDYAAAAPFEKDIQREVENDNNYYWIYADYLIAHQRFGDTDAVLRQMAGQAIPDRYFWERQAVVAAQHFGLQGHSAQEPLQLLADDPRYPNTLPGARCDVAQRLWESTGDAKWWEVLAGSARRNPTDPEVLGALAIGWARRAPSAAELAASDLPREWDHPLPVALAGQAAALAQTPAQQIGAWLNVVEAACAKRADGQYYPASDRSAIHALQAALGDPAVPDCVHDESMPNYGDLIVRSSVVQRRAADPEFDTQFHNTIMRLLNRRQELFKDSLNLPPLPLRASPAGGGT